MTSSSGSGGDSGSMAAPSRRARRGGNGSSGGSSSSSSSSSRGSSSRAATAAAAALLALALGPACAAAAGARYNPWAFNKACRYTATNVPANLFRNGVDAGKEYLFPLETDRAVKKYERPWEACFGPKEAYSLSAIEAGFKLPCRYTVNAKGNYDFEEEHACDVLVRGHRERRDIRERRGERE